MPVDFKWSPHCVFATLVAIEPHDVALVGGGAQSWRGETAEGEAFEIDEAGLRAQGHPIRTNEAGVGVYAIKDLENRVRRYEVDHRAGLVRIEGVEEPMALEKFRAEALRTTPEGKVISSFVQPLYEQRLASDEAGRDGELHLMDIRGFTDAARDQGDEVEAGMVDIISAGLKDQKSGMDMLRALVGVRRPLKETFPIFDKLAEHGIPLHYWHEVKDIPTFGVEQVRALFRELLKDQIGDFPLEHIARIELPREYAGQLADAFGRSADRVGVEPAFEPRNIIPGYRTSEVVRFRGEGLDAILFTDMRATYAYVFPMLPTLDDEPAAPGMR